MRRRTMRFHALAGSLVAAGVLALAPGCASSAADEAEPTEATDSAYSASSMPREVNRRVATCFVRDWSQTPLSIATDPTYGDTFIGPLAHASLDAVQSVGYVLMLGSAGDVVLRQLESDLNRVAREEQLKDYQKAILVTCVTSQLITYAMNVISKLLGPAAATEQLEGVCTEYAGIAVRLFHSLDLEADVRTGMLVEDKDSTAFHAWNWVKVDGKTLWMEPQSNPLRLTGPLFIDPDRLAPKTPQYLRCDDPGAVCTSGATCCSGSCVVTKGKGKCASTSCERSGASFCAPSAAACTHIGGSHVNSACGASVDGPACCSYTR